MGSYQEFEMEQLQADRSRSYAEFLRRPGVSMGIYHLPVGGKDPQHPHAADEVYVVLAGRATLEVEGHRIDVGPGKVVSVDVGADHRFVDVTEDLQVLVVFAPPDDPAA
jgi:mannose-6-phosphate isomerase-like protein (cupin superfamily)